jgi:hypothetical protein
MVSLAMEKESVPTMRLLCFEGTTVTIWEGKKRQAKFEVEGGLTDELFTELFEMELKDDEPTETESNDRA